MTDAAIPTDAITLPPAEPLRDLCKRFGISFKKGLGQNLLLDDNINRIMVDAAALTRDDAVVEVGAGLGALTRRIVVRAGDVLAVEIDATFMPVLQEQFGHLPHVKLFRGDILNHSLAKLVAEYLPPKAEYKFLSNLPYYITTPILFHFLESPVHFSRLVVMMQREVGDRLVSMVNTENYGVLTIAGHIYAEVDLVHHVPASCFLPRPKVDSCIVRFRTRKEPLAGADTPFTMSLIRAAFSQRRKTLRNSLVKSGNFGAPAEAVLDALDATGIDPGARPQTLSPEQFITLARAIKARLPEEPKPGEQRA
ncbi:MAG: rRNA ((1518)-N(6)/adenine(1519)-N(6))-dimethyltransferase RsmA [Candidatus Hydrogenedentota bacterium]